jgi:hypothetical protein
MSKIIARSGLYFDVEFPDNGSVGRESRYANVVFTAYNTDMDIAGFIEGRVSYV